MSYFSLFKEKEKSDVKKWPIHHLALTACLRAGGLS